MFTGVSDGTVWAFTEVEVGLDVDFVADFLNMDVRFLPVLKKAAPTKIFGLGLRLLKETVMAFLGSADLVVVVLLMLLLEGTTGFTVILRSHSNSSTSRAKQIEHTNSKQPVSATQLQSR